jgi:hypothetical protein
MKLHVFSEDARKWLMLEWIVTGYALSAPPVPEVPEAA